ncbi:hypothetical protein N7508_009382 [Penicillium antarcticum]|uniref:uncharacterized protein n=1 Tax=Penicillium antarcticum TaxID=416450 RepID=UPI00238D4F67|nr:uncharacterized protein N7508_009382 [Penicillium antarcticum]KAJ5294561.1 hypothetical protein N7508_009382 [Penicillium antarcticum]
MSPYMQLQWNPLANLAPARSGGKKAVLNLCPNTLSQDNPTANSARSRASPMKAKRETYMYLYMTDAIDGALN